MSGAISGIAVPHVAALMRATKVSINQSLGPAHRPPMRNRIAASQQLRAFCLGKFISLLILCSHPKGRIRPASAENHAPTQSQQGIRLHADGCGAPAADLRGPEGGAVRHHPGAMGGAVAARSPGGAQAIRVRRNPRPAADLADAPARPAVRQRPDRAPRRSQRPPRQAALSHAGGAAAARTAQRARRGLAVDCARGRRTRGRRSRSSHSLRPSKKICARPSSKGRPATRHWNRPMANTAAPTVLKFAPDAPSLGCAQELARRHAAQAAAAHPAGGRAAHRGARRAFDLPDGRPLHLDRQRLRRRAEGADHAGHFRQDHQRRGAGGPARVARRRAVRNRSGAVPARRAPGAEQARNRSHRLQQSQEAISPRSPSWSISRKRPSSSSRRTSTARPRWSPAAPARRPTSIPRWPAW